MTTVIRIVMPSGIMYLTSSIIPFTLVQGLMLHSFRPTFFSLCVCGVSVVNTISKYYD